MLKSLSKRKNTWLNYLDRVKGNSSGQELLQLGCFKEFFRTDSFANSFFRHCTPLIYLLDYRKCAYTRMSGNFAGYHAAAFLEGGISHMLDIYHPDHLRLFNEEVFPERLEFLDGVKPQEQNSYLFTYNLCLRNAAGRYENFLQRNCFVPDALGNPVFSMGMLTPLNDHHTGKRIIQSIDKICINGLVEQRLVDRKVYYLNEEDKLFSKREKEVLLWMADGFSSKMIAEKLNISEHTVINHRRSMQEKSNKPNATALVSFAIRNGII
ncbi:response regulator transcription factor [Pedobacter hartonius]|uniref:Regulatory protein, luxR family n=1 Tax=Pedobacter hartonius TaxID=425514 RepID=A0A1H4H9N2_9SPHI|nr:LuxR family transcriptional regulator [Pedobacter hartonius]SEB18547.1 regulatory protein, luxR family [Pedobacter hartonius]